MTSTSGYSQADMFVPKAHYLFADQCRSGAYGADIQAVGRSITTDSSHVERLARIGQAVRGNPFHELIVVDVKHDDPMPPVANA